MNRLSAQPGCGDSKLLRSALNLSNEVCLRPRSQLSRTAESAQTRPPPRFPAALTSGAHADEIQADEAADQALGFPGTPSMRIGSTTLNGAQLYDRISELAR